MYKRAAQVVNKLFVVTIKLSSVLVLPVTKVLRVGHWLPPRCCLRVGHWLL